jgi:hypothetical protein
MAVMHDVRKQIMSRGRVTKFFNVKSNEKDSTKQQEFYRSVNEKEDIFHIKINILGSNLKQVLWMRSFSQK